MRMKPIMCETFKIEIINNELLILAMFLLQYSFTTLIARGEKNIKLLKG